MLDRTIGMLATLALAIATFNFSVVHLGFPSMDGLYAFVLLVYSLFAVAALVVVGAGLWIYRQSRYESRGWRSAGALAASATLMSLAAWLPERLFAADQSPSVAYANPAIGLELSYPSDWRIMSPELRKIASEGDGSLMDKITFGIHKAYPAATGSDNANLLVIAQRVDDATCKAMDDGSLESGEATEFPRTMPGGHLVQSRHVRIRGLRGYTGEHVSSKSKLTVVQHVYWYCFHNQGVIVQGTAGTPESEQALARILGSIRISGR